MKNKGYTAPPSDIAKDFDIMLDTIDPNDIIDVSEYVWGFNDECD